LAFIVGLKMAQKSVDSDLIQGSEVAGEWRLDGTQCVWLSTFNIQNQKDVLHPF
jgi:hypothetical protein